MAVLELVLLFAALTSLLALCWFVLTMDGDLTLMLAEKLGKDIGSLRGRVVWVIGCANGIGEALVHLLSQNGVKLVLTDIDGEGLVALRKSCIERGLTKERDMKLVAFDITNFAAHREAFAKVLAHFGQLDLVFHNAGCSQTADYIKVTTEVDKEIFDVNCFGHVSLSRLALDHFLQDGRGGHFVVTSSMVGRLAFPRASSYVASKHAIIGYFETLRLEHFTDGVGVTIICPGPVFSSLYDRSYTDESGKFYTGGMKPTDRRMPTSRCARLMALAAANKLEEAWPCIQPMLAGFYLSQFTPYIFRRMFKFFLTRYSANQLRQQRP